MADAGVKIPPFSSLNRPAAGVAIRFLSNAKQMADSAIIRLVAL